LKDETQKISVILIIAAATFVLMVINSVQIQGMMGEGSISYQSKGGKTSLGSVIEMPSGTT